MSTTAVRVSRQSRLTPSYVDKVDLHEFLAAAAGSPGSDGQEHARASAQTASPVVEQRDREDSF